MRQIFRTLVGGGFLILLLAGALSVSAQSPSTPAAGASEAKQNVLVTFRMGKLEGEQRTPVKSYQLVVAAGTLGSKLLSGQRIPFPAHDRPSPTATGNDGPARFVYQNIGFVTDVKVWIVDKTHVRLMADIEDSRVVAGEDGAPPTVETRQLTVNAILTDGEPMEVARAVGVTDQPGFVEIEAKILP